MSATISEVPYGAPLSGVQSLPAFRVRGWDDGSVYVDVYCVCGRVLFNDDRPLSTTGQVSFQCGDPSCERSYVIQVMCGMSEGKEQR